MRPTRASSTTRRSRGRAWPRNPSPSWSRIAPSFYTASPCRARLAATRTLGTRVASRCTAE
eukprot:7380461-Prymnesium_polylepis.2